MDLQQYSSLDLLKLHAGLIQELRRRGVVRSANGPVGDYGELLFSRAFGWKLLDNSAAGFDAVDANDVRYQIKCRRVTPDNPSRQLSALRRLDTGPFDLLAGIIFNGDFSVHRAALIPIATVMRYSTFTPHVNAHRFILRDSVWQLPDVRDVTHELRAAQEAS